MGEKRECVRVCGREWNCWECESGWWWSVLLLELSLKQNLRHEPESRQVVACFTTLGSRAVACAFPPLCPHPDQGPADKWPNPELTASTQYREKLEIWCGDTSVDRQITLGLEKRLQDGIVQMAGEKQTRARMHQKLIATDRDRLSRRAIL